MSRRDSVHHPLQMDIHHDNRWLQSRHTLDGFVAITRFADKLEVIVFPRNNRVRSVSLQNCFIAAQLLGEVRLFRGE